MLLHQHVLGSIVARTQMQLNEVPRRERRRQRGGERSLGQNATNDWALCTASLPSSGHDIEETEQDWQVDYWVFDVVNWGDVVIRVGSKERMKGTSHQRATTESFQD